MKICITGSAGNLGGLLSEYLVDTTENKLHLMTHHKNVSKKLEESNKTIIFKADLDNKESLYDCLKDIDVIVHFAGILFKGNPENFLPKTNTQFFKNLCDVAVEQGVKRIILISFPHVEGETTVENPATGRLDCTPISAHATTRLEEEKYMFNEINAKGVETVSLRVGMVYGRGILMVDGARWFAKYNLLGIWKEPTSIHLISTDDFLESTKNAIIKDTISGIYHIGDEGVQTLQEFLNIATQEWGYKKPWIMPSWMIHCAATLFEYQSLIFSTKAPLTRDFVKIGKISYYGDTKRMREDLLEILKYKTLQDGKGIL